VVKSGRVRWREGEDVQKPPTIKGIQNAALVLYAFQTWNAMAPRNRKRDMTDAPIERTYCQR
jgi:hypothetical protein